MREVPEHGWTCFHCGETFTQEHEARCHFGDDETSDTACRIVARHERGLLEALRRAERDAANAMEAIHNECTDAAKAYHAQLARHNEQLREVEEHAYEKGLYDRKHVAAAE